MVKPTQKSNEYGFMKGPIKSSGTKNVFKFVAESFIRILLKIGWKNDKCFWTAKMFIFEFLNSRLHCKYTVCIYSAGANLECVYYTHFKMCNVHCTATAINFVENDIKPNIDYQKVEIL